MVDNNIRRYRVLSPKLRINRRATRNLREVKTAVLGDVNGIVSTSSDPFGQVRVRFDASSDSNDNATKTGYTLVYHDPRANYLPDAGRRVFVGKDLQGREAVLGAVGSDLEQAGIDPRAFNFARRENKYVRLSNVSRLMSRPVGTINTQSNLVNVQPAIFDFYNQRVVWRGTELQADKIDLSSYVPTVGNHRLAMVWLSLLDQTLHVSTSTAQTVFTDFDATDFDELFRDRPFEAVPIQAYMLANAQVSVDVSALYEDLRQFINVPARVGFPSIIEYREHIRANYRVLTYGTITTEKTLNIEGTITTL